MMWVLDVSVKDGLTGPREKKAEAARVGALGRPLRRRVAGAHRWGGPGGRGQKRMIALPQVKPAPNAPVASTCPRCSRPLRTHSSSAIGIEAAVVLP
jgi:hypothetical protein